MKENIGDVRDDVRDAIDKKRDFNKFNESLRHMPLKDKRELLAVLENVEDSLNEKGHFEGPTVLTRTLEIGGTVATIAGAILYFMGMEDVAGALVGTVGVPAIAAGAGLDWELEVKEKRRGRLEKLRQALSS